MRESRFVWLLSLPLVLAGCLTAHVAAYFLVAPETRERAEVLSQTGHAYLAHLPVIGAALATAALVGLGRVALASARGRRTPRPAPWLFALLPPLAFTAQEHVERLLSSGGSPVLEHAFAIGLLLQAPFALLAWLLARTLLRAAVSLGAALRRPTPRATPHLAPEPARCSEPLRRSAVLRRSPRAPPARLALQP